MQLHDFFSKKREERGSRDNLRDINRDYEERGKL